MHEMSILRALLDQVERVRCDHPEGLLTSIHVQVGPLSGVEPLLLVSAFAQVAAQNFENEVEFVVEEVPLQGYCERCNQSTEIQDYRFRCGHCDSTEVRIQSGDTVQLQSISLRTEECTMETS